MISVQIKSNQGSRIAPPLFFIFYINDIFRLVLRGRLQLFADDAALTYSSATLADLRMDMQHDLFLIQAWFNDNRLLVITTKSKYILFSRSSIRSAELSVSDFSLFLNGHVIERVRTYTYLGLVFDSGLRWRDHTLKVKAAIGPYIFMLNRTRFYISEATSHDLLRIHLLKAGISSSGMGQSTLEPLRVLQHRAIKAIYAQANPLCFPLHQ